MPRTLTKSFLSIEEKKIFGNFSTNFSSSLSTLDPNLAFDQIFVIRRTTVEVVHRVFLVFQTSFVQKRKSSNLKIKSKKSKEKINLNSIMKVILDSLFVLLDHVDYDFLVTLYACLSIDDYVSLWSFDLDLEHFPQRLDRRPVEDSNVEIEQHVVEPNVLERLQDFPRIDHDVLTKQKRKTKPKSKTMKRTKIYF